ncbi:hypothetical protein K458DRAFT_481293 [Lentithecium fluviatile CBS 122367]|uniref:AAA protein C-terminal winged helix domain-containing protein n=1 Tax=Lentithecium fluviatile CBS 122367 TaxID=1168545 RepID=A0A6G1IHD4_9PLEO|nr:hypothetical protein K458DRAFT_481293 [Lentithecium fluviatile CBS 122367]
MSRSPQSFRRGWILLQVGGRPTRLRASPLLYHLPRYNEAPVPNASSEPPKQERSKFARSVLEGSTVALISLIGLGLGGYAYTLFYKKKVFDKIKNAFSRGYSSNELVSLGRIAFGTHPDMVKEVLEKEHWVPRTEQPVIDDIMSGKSRGRYYLVMGERGTGKRSLLLESMRKVHGDGIVMLEAHNDLEVFRVRLGKALDFEYHEDYIGSLFSIKGPGDSTPLLDIERALNQMEKVALKMRKARRKPLLLVINNIHLFKDDTGGSDLLELLQQRAEIWAGNELVTVVFTSDEHWTLEKLIPRATNMHVFNIRDVKKDTVTTALKQYRARFHKEDVPQSILDEVAKSGDMLETCRYINKREKSWFLNLCWILGDTMDDVEEPQKFCAAAVILARTLVHRETPLSLSTGLLPEIPLHESRQIITRADFVHRFDHINVIHIDANGMVRADSVPMQNAFREICGEEGFEEHLKKTLDRLDELESLSRTREAAVRELPGRSGREVPRVEYCAKI